MSEASAVMKPREVRELLGVHRNTMERWVREGKLPTVEIAGKRRFLRRDIDRLLKREAA